MEDSEKQLLVQLQERVEKIESQLKELIEQVKKIKSLP